MKKRLFLIAFLALICSVSSANNFKNNQEMSNTCSCKCQNNCKNENPKNNEKNSLNKQNACKENQTTCSKCEIEDDDEYFTYNLCYFDKQFRNMKRELCLTRRQEKYIDNIYKNFKYDMENLFFKYQNERNKLLANFECNCINKKENKRKLKEYKKEAKEKYKDFKEEIKEQLCKKQLSQFRKFQREEKRKISKIKKYCIVYKFPCLKCSSK